MDDPRSSSRIDSYIGNRVRMARKILNLSQQDLAQRLGISFQQVQKYEKGTNRISASRLHQLALIVGVPVSFFFPETGAGADGTIPSNSGQARQLDRILSPQGIDAALFLTRIKDEKIRHRALSLLRALTDTSE